MRYWQTIAAYPNGAGGYIVATDNLGRLPGLIGAAALLIDYILTVAVSSTGAPRATGLGDAVSVVVVTGALTTCCTVADVLPAKLASPL